MKHLLTAALVPVAMLASQSHAALATPYVNSIASINNISVSTTGTASFEYSFTDAFVADAIVNSGSAYEESALYSDGFPSTVFVQSADSGFYTEAQATASELNQSYAVADMSGNAYAQAYSNLGFDVSGAGEVSISFDVNYIVDLLAVTGDEYLNFGISVADSFGGYESLSGEFLGWDGDAFLSESDVLTLSFLVDGAEQGYLELSTWALADTGVAPVPVPAAAWLFGSALLGLAGIQRRRKKSQ